jgi:hypothetical protein
MSASKELTAIMRAKSRSWWSEDDPLVVPLDLWERVLEEMRWSLKFVTADPEHAIVSFKFLGKTVVTA